MSQIYADEVIPPRAADSRGQNKTNAEDAGSDWDFLELNGKAAAERSSAMQGDGSITLKSSRDEAVRRQRAYFRGAPDTPSPTLSQKTEPDTRDRAFREVLARLKEANLKRPRGGRPPREPLQAVFFGPWGWRLPTMRMSAGSGSAFSLSVRLTT